MPIYDPNPAIISSSLLELRKIGSWITDRQEDGASPKTVLIGGWAVDAYIPYLGSVDIDLVTNSTTKRSLMHHLQSHEGYKYDTLFPFGKTVYRDASPYGRIILDFATRESDYPFEGHPNLPFTLGILEGNTEMRSIRGVVDMAVPNRATLLTLKLKAAHDRRFRIEHGRSYDAEWEAGKMVKDCTDILALIDPDAGGREIDLETLGSQVSDYPFLKDLLHRIPDMTEVQARYERLSVQDIRTLCQTLESVL